VETVEYNHMTFTSFDVGCACHPTLKRRIDSLKSASDVAGVIWMVDCNDRDRLVEAQEELWRCISKNLAEGVPILVLVNKQDLQVLFINEVSVKSQC
jgi:signal recognition particle receptor subunit beta